MGEEEKKPAAGKKMEEKKVEDGKKGEEEKKEKKEETKQGEKPAAPAEGKKAEGPKDEKESKEESPVLPQEIILRVYMHCEGCARKVRRCLKDFEGVEDVMTDYKSNKVVVKGEKADPLKVLERVQRKSHRQVELLSPIPKPPAPEEKKAEEKEKLKPEEKKEEPQVIMVVLKVHMHCEACAQEIKKRIQKMKGVESAEPDLKSSEVTVKGVFNPPKLVEYVYKRTGKHAAIVKQEPDNKKEDKGKDEKKGEEGGGDKDKKEAGGGGGDDKKGGETTTEADSAAGGPMLSLQRFFSSRRAPVISTGSLKLDLALGIGGLPKGRMVEIYGREASGKTTLALHIIKEAQKFGGYCAYFDVENAMDPSLAESIGVNIQNLLISYPDSAENLLCAVDTLTKSGSVDVIVVDSVAALVPQCEIDGSIGDSKRDVQAQIMTRALRKIYSSLCRSRTLIIFLNQVRYNPKPGQAFRHMDEDTCGGNALKFYSAIRLRMIRTGLLKSEEKVTGLGVCVQVVKNKLAPAMQKAELGIQFGRGFCCESEVLELACEHGIISKEGSNYFIEGKVFGDKQEAERYLAEKDGVLDNIAMVLRTKLFERKI